MPGFDHQSDGPSRQLLTSLLGQNLLLSVNGQLIPMTLRVENRHEGFFLGHLHDRRKAESPERKFTLSFHPPINRGMGTGTEFGGPWSQGRHLRAGLLYSSRGVQCFSHQGSLPRQERVVPEHPGTGHFPAETVFRRCHFSGTAA